MMNRFCRTVLASFVFVDCYDRTIKRCIDIFMLVESDSKNLSFLKRGDDNKVVIRYINLLFTYIFLYSCFA